MPTPPTTSTTARRAARLAAAVAVAAVAGTAGLGVLAGPAAADDTATSSLQIAKEVRTAPVAVTCAGLATRYGASWHELRFSSLPAPGGSATASAAGVTATVTRLSPSAVAFTASRGIDLVFVNAGTWPDESNATYRYDPPARGASGLSGTVPSDVVDHVLLCVGDEPAPTSIPTTVTPPPAPATEVPSPTTTAPVVRCLNPPTCQIARPAPRATPPATPNPAAPTVLRLPETGGDSRVVALAGTALALLGGLALLAGRSRRASNG